MPSSFVAYVDESGDEGFCFGGGASDWFVLSAVVLRKPNDPSQIFGVVDDVRKQVGIKGRRKIKFRKLKPVNRAFYVARILQTNVRLVSVLIHKPSLADAETFQGANILYFYTTRYLVERLSWFCRDHRLPHDAGDGRVEIVFDERTGMEYANMRDYIGLLREQEALRPTSIEWSVIDPGLITTSTGGKRVGLQVADAVAGSFFCAVDSEKGQGCYDYGNALRPLVYRSRKGIYRGYGLKVFPGCDEPKASAFIAGW